MKYRDLVLNTVNKELSQEDKLINGVMGLAGEAGEVIDLVKKFKFHKKPMDKDKLLKELGDVRWYLELIAISIDSTVEEIEQLNIKKLTERYPNGFNPKDSELRRDVK